MLVHDEFSKVDSPQGDPISREKWMETWALGPRETAESSIIYRNLQRD